MDFWKDLADNKEMSEELRKEIEAAEKIDAAGKVDLIVEFAKKKGYPVDEEDVQLAKAKLAKLEMSDEELAKLSAAASDEEQREICALDYLCLFTWNNCLVSNECFFEGTTCDNAVGKSGWINSCKYIAW